MNNSNRYRDRLTEADGNKDGKIEIHGKGHSDIETKRKTDRKGGTQYSQKQR